MCLPKLSNSPGARALCPVSLAIEKFKTQAVELSAGTESQEQQRGDPPSHDDVFKVNAGGATASHR